MEALALGRDELRTVVDGRTSAIIAESWSAPPGRALLLFGHEYRIPHQQLNLYLALDRLVEAMPLPVYADGFSGPRPARRGGVIHDAERRRAAAADRLKAPGSLAIDVLGDVCPVPTAVVGIDDAALIEQQHAQVAAIRAGIDAFIAGRAQVTAVDLLQTCFDQTFPALVEHLEARMLNPRLRQLVTTWAGRSTLGLGAFTTRLSELASTAGIDVSGYPNMRSLLSALEMERTLDFTQVEAERNALVERLVGKSQESPSPEQARRLERWIEAGSTAERGALAAYGEQASPEDDIGMRWLGHLVAMSMAYRDGLMAISAYNRRLRDLAQALGIPLEQSTGLDQYIRYMAIADQFETNELVSSEWPGLREEIAEEFASTAAERGLLALRTRLEDLGRLALLRLPAARVQPVLRAQPSATGWIDEITRLGQTALGANWTESAEIAPAYRTARGMAAVVEAGLPAARAYYDAAEKRSVALLDNALAAASGGAAILVCGRFHLHHAVRALRRQPDLSWAVVAPRMKATGEQREFNPWCWGLADIEWASAESLERDTPSGPAGTDATSRPAPAAAAPVTRQRPWWKFWA